MISNMPLAYKIQNSIAAKFEGDEALCPIPPTTPTIYFTTTLLKVAVPIITSVTPSFTVRLSS